MYTTDKDDTEYRWRPGMVIVFILLFAALGAGGYFFYQYQQSQQELTSLKQSPSQSAAEQKKTVLAELGKIVELPTNEDPTVATVTDITKLTDQPFFADAHNGDVVIIYKLSKKAIIYSPSAHKIVDMAQVNLDNQTQLAPTASPPEASGEGGATSSADQP